MEVICIYCCFESTNEASEISDHLVKSKLVACANILPEIQSKYIWQNKLNTQKEVPVLFKTNAINKDRVFFEIKKLHSYETPGIISFKPESIDKEFNEWIIASTALASL